MTRRVISAAGGGVADPAPARADSDWDLPAFPPSRSDGRSGSGIHTSNA